MAHRSLNDAHTKGLSDDCRFGIAYDAARILATAVIRASGYRVKLEGGAHYNTFQGLAAADGDFNQLALYFDVCRKKRNDFQYERVDVVSSLETEELLLRVVTFAQTVEEWIKKHHQELTA